MKMMGVVIPEDLKADDLRQYIGPTSRPQRGNIVDGEDLFSEGQHLADEGFIEVEEIPDDKDPWPHRWYLLKIWEILGDHLTDDQIITWLNTPDQHFTDETSVAFDSPLEIIEMGRGDEVITYLRGLLPVTDGRPLFEKLNDGMKEEVEEMEEMEEEAGSMRLDDDLLPCDTCGQLPDACVCGLCYRILILHDDSGVLNALGRAIEDIADEVAEEWGLSEENVSVLRAGEINTAQDIFDNNGLALVVMGCCVFSNQCNTGPLIEHMKKCDPSLPIIGVASMFNCKLKMLEHHTDYVFDNLTESADLFAAVRDILHAIMKRGL